MNPEDRFAFWVIIFIALVVLGIGIAAIAQYSISRPKPKRGEEDVYTVGIGLLYLHATVELFLYSAYFWVFREWVSAKDGPKITLSIVFIACAYLIPYVLQRRSKLVFFPFALHGLLVLYVFLTEGSIGYPHFLNLVYAALAFGFIFLFALSGFFNPNSSALSTEKPKVKNGNPERQIELRNWSNGLLALSTLHLALYLLDFSFHIGQIPPHAALYFLITVACAYLSAYFLRKGLFHALIPTVASVSVYLYFYFAWNRPATYPFHLHLYYNLIVVAILMYFLAKKTLPTPSFSLSYQQNSSPKPSFSNSQNSTPKPQPSKSSPQNVAYTANEKAQSQKPKPAQFMRDTLFGDLPLDVWAAVERDMEPWASFSRARKAVSEKNEAQARLELENVVKQSKLETRQYLQAWHILRQLGGQVPREEAKHVYGVIIESALPQGLDILAVYEDDAARYYPAGGGGVILDPEPDRDYTALHELLAQARTVVGQLKPLEAERPKPPTQNIARVYILTASGLHIAYEGSAGMNAINRHIIAKPLFEAARNVLQMMNNLAAEMAATGKGMTLHPPQQGQENQIHLVYTRLQNGRPINSGAQSSPINALSLKHDNPQSLDDWHNRGMFHAISGNYPAALADFNRAIEISPDCLYAYVSRANAYATSGNYEAAMADYEHVLALDPMLADAYINRGLSYFRQGKTKEALLDLESAVSLVWEAYIMRAMVYTQLKEYDKALADSNSLIALQPELAAAYQMRAQLYNKMGNTQAAMADAMRAKNFSTKKP